MAALTSGFPQDWDFRICCNICNYVGPSEKELKRHHRNHHGDVYFCNLSPLSSSYKPVYCPKTPYCHICKIYIGYGKEEVHLTNKLHIFRCPAVGGNKSESALNFYRCVEERGVGFRTNMLMESRCPKISSIPLNGIIYGCHICNDENGSRWIKLPVVSHDLYLPLTSSGRDLFQLVSSSEVSGIVSSTGSYECICDVGVHHRFSMHFDAIDSVARPVLYGDILHHCTTCDDDDSNQWIMYCHPERGYRFLPVLWKHRLLFSLTHISIRNEARELLLSQDQEMWGDDASELMVGDVAVAKKTRYSDTQLDHLVLHPYGYNRPDWLGRDSCLDFSKDRLISRVFLVALKYPSTLAENTKKKLMEDGRDWIQYFRGRVVDVHVQVDGRKIVYLYCLDTEKCYVPTTQHERGSPLAVIREEDLLGVGYSLPDNDVLRNMMLNKVCDFCGTTDFSNGEPRVCDSPFPSLFGFEFADASAFACHRGFICAACESTEMDPRKKDLYFCKACRNGPLTVADAWSSGIKLPTYDYQPGVIPITSFPDVPSDTLACGQPCDILDRFLDTMRSRRDEVIRALSRAGNETKAQVLVTAAAELLRKARTRGMSSADLEAMLESIHFLNENKALFLDDTTGDHRLTLPKTVETLLRRADGTVILDKDVILNEYIMDQSPLRQLWMCVRVWTVDWKLLLQTILLDPTYPAGSCRLNSCDDLIPAVIDDSGVKVRGPELYDGTRYEQLLRTCPRGTKLLYLVSFSDGILCGKDTHWPFSVSIGNFPGRFRRQRTAINYVALAEKPKKRKPRSSGTSETYDEEQKVYSQALSSRLVAQVYAQLEPLSKEVLWFWVRQEDGSLVKVPFSIRWGLWQADCEEILHGFSFSGKNCYCCNGPQVAMVLHGAPGKGGRPFISEGHSCTESADRYPLDFVKEQHRIKLLEREGKTKKASAEAAKKARVRPTVWNSLFAFETFLPHGCQGPFGLIGLDILHTIKKGILWILLLIMDAIMRKCFKKGGKVNNPEDVRGFCDDCFASMNGNPLAQDFRYGFWAAGDSGKALGKEVWALSLLYPLVLAGNSFLLDDEPIRKKLLQYSALILSLSAEYQTEQTYSAADMENLREDVKESTKGLHWLMDTLERLYPNKSHDLGHVFDILKAHLWGGGPKFLERFGSNRQSDTEDGERSQKEMKLNHDRVGEAPAAVLQRLVANKFDRVLGIGTRASSDEVRTPITELPVFRNLRGKILSGPSWEKAVIELRSGERGPLVSEETIKDLHRLLQMRSRDEHIEFEPRAAVRVTSEDASYQEISLGHTVLLHSGAYGQVLIPRIHGPPGMFEPDAAVITLFCSAPDADEDTGYHPEFPVPFLQYADVKLICGKDIKERAHVVPYFGDLYRDEERRLELYLVNTFQNPRIRAVNRRQFFWKCPSTGCEGRVPFPPCGYGTFQCPMCSYKYP